MGKGKPGGDYVEQLTEPGGWTEADEDKLDEVATESIQALQQLTFGAFDPWQRERSETFNGRGWSGDAAGAANGQAGAHSSEFAEQQNNLVKVATWNRQVATLVANAKSTITSNVQDAQQLIKEIKNLMSGVPFVGALFEAAAINYIISTYHGRNVSEIAATTANIPAADTWKSPPNALDQLLSENQPPAAPAPTPDSLLPGSGPAPAPRAPINAGPQEVQTLVQQSTDSSSNAPQAEEPVTPDGAGTPADRPPAQATDSSSNAPQAEVPGNPANAAPGPISAPGGPPAAPPASRPSGSPTSTVSTASGPIGSPSAGAPSGAPASTAAASGAPTGTPAVQPAGAGPAADAAAAKAPVTPMQTSPMSSSPMSAPLADPHPATPAAASTHTGPAASTAGGPASAPPVGAPSSGGATGGTPGGGMGGGMPLGAPPTAPPAAPVPPAAVAGAAPSTATAAPVQGGAQVAPVPVSAARAERDAAQNAVRRNTNEYEPLNVARRIAAALNAPDMLNVEDFFFHWITAVTKDGKIVVANNYGLAYIPEHVQLPQQVVMASADESIPVTERGSWATFPILAVQRWAQHHDKELRAVIGTEEQFAGGDSGAHQVILTPEDIPASGKMSGRDRLPVIAPEISARLAGFSDADLVSVLPPAPADSNPPEDQRPALWDKVWQPLCSSAANRGTAHLQAFLIYAAHAQEHAFYQAHSASEPQDQRKAADAFIYWQHVGQSIADALAT